MTVAPAAATFGASSLARGAAVGEERDVEVGEVSRGGVLDEDLLALEGQRRAG